MIKYITRLRNKVLGINAIHQKIQDEQKETIRQIKYHQKELQAIELLSGFLPKNYFPVTGFSLSFQQIQHIINDIAYFKPNLILEFGSGISTVIISNFLKANNFNAKFYSVDNDLEWQSQVKNQIAGNNNTEFLNFPIGDTEFSFKDEKVKWYQIPSNHFLRSLNEIDLVIIDGPFGGICKYSRFGFIPFLMNKLSIDAIIFVDDTHRPDEMDICEEAREVFLKNKTKFFDYSRLANSSSFSSNP
jgi:hypothetical protein